MCTANSVRRRALRLFLSLALWHAVAGFRYGIFSAAVSAVKGGGSGASSHDYEDEGEDDEGAWLDDLEMEEDDDYTLMEMDEDEPDNRNTDSSSLLDALQLHPLLQIPAAFSLSGFLYSSDVPVRTYLDTGAMRTVMSFDVAERLGVAQHLDRRYSGEATGIGSARVLGRLPAGLFAMHLHGSVTVTSPAITILESTGLPGVELLLGLDFLRECKAIVDLRKEEVRLVVEGKEHAIPFIRPRGMPPRLASDERESDWDIDAEEPTNFHAYEELAPECEDERFLDATSDEEDAYPDMSGV